jgi:hypothetical protein
VTACFAVFGLITLFSFGQNGGFVNAQKSSKNNELCAVFVPRYFEYAVPNLKVISDALGCTWTPTLKRWKRDGFCVVKAGKEMLEGFQHFNCAKIAVDDEPEVDSCPPLSSPETLSSPTGTLTSPNYPNEYTSNRSRQQNCSWIIEAPRGSVVKLNINTAILESVDKNRCWDFLKISDPDDGTVLAELCHQTTPMTYFSITNRLQLSLIQDRNVGAEGFSLNWEFLEDDQWDYSCNFENGLCYGWESSPQVEFEWERISGPTPTANTGPPGDHTTGTGFYMYAESSRRQKGDRAVLSSPVFLGGRKLCASYWYHMNGTGMGELIVTVDQIKGSPNFNTQHHFGNQGTSWKKGYFDVDLSGGPNDTYMVQFMAKRGDSYASDIAIDDIQLIPVSFGTPCPNDPNDAEAEGPTQFPDLFTIGSPPNLGVEGTELPGLVDTKLPLPPLFFSTVIPLDEETTAPLLKDSDESVEVEKLPLRFFDTTVLPLDEETTAPLLGDSDESVEEDSVDYDSTEEESTGEKSTEEESTEEESTEEESTEEESIEEESIEDDSIDE